MSFRNSILTLTLQCRKMVRHTLKVLQHLLQDFKSVSQHFMTLRLSHFMTLRLRLFLPFIEPKKMLGIIPGRKSSNRTSGWQLIL